MSEILATPITAMGATSPAMTSARIGDLFDRHHQRLYALALGAAWWPASEEESLSAPTHRGEATQTVDTPTTRTETMGAGNARENRKIQFETPGGTLVVWVLNPNFPS